MPPDIRTGPMTLAAGTPPGRASALLAPGPPGDDPLAALFASLLAHSGGPVALPLKAAPTPGEAPKGKPKDVPLLPAPIKIRPNTPLTAGVTVGPKKTEQQIAEKTMDTSPVPAPPDRDKAGAKPSGELPLQGAGANSSGLPALPVLLYVPPTAMLAPIATDRATSLPVGLGQKAAAPSLTISGASLTPTAPVPTAETSAPGGAAPAAAPVQTTLTAPPQPVLTAPANAAMAAALPQVTLAALGAEPAALGTPKVTPAAPSVAELTVTDGSTATDGRKAMDGPIAKDGKAATEGRTATAGSLITEGQGAKDGVIAKEGKSAMDGPVTTDEQSARDGGTATDGRFTANVNAATDGTSATDGSTAMEGPIATESKVAMDGKSATDGNMLTAGEPKTGLKSAAMVADTITSTRAQGVQPKAMPMDLQPPVSGTRLERRAGSVGSDAPPPLPAQAPVQAAAVSTEAKPLSAADWAEVIRQAADGVGTMPPPAKPGAPEQMTLQLHPKEWGQLQVSVTVTPGSHPNAVQAVTAHIVAQNPQVKAALEGQSSDLRQALREAGLHLDRISVTVQSMDASAQSGTATSGGRHEASHGGTGQGMGGAFGETAPDQKTGMSGGTRTSDGTGMSGASGNGMPSTASGGSSGGRQGGQPPPAYAAAYAPTEPEDVTPLGAPRRPASGQIDTRA